MYLFIITNFSVIVASSILTLTTYIYYTLVYGVVSNLILIILVNKIISLHEKDAVVIAKLNKNLQNFEEKNNLLSAVLNNIDMAIWARNKNLEIVYFNKKYAEIALNENIALDCQNFEIDKFARSAATYALNNKGKSFWEERYLVINGKRYLYQFIDSALTNSDIIICSGYDVTSKDVINKELQQNIQAQDDLLESTSNASAIFNKDRKLKFFNQAFVKLWGLSEEFLESYPTYENILDKLHSMRKLPEQANYSNFRKEQLKLFTDLTGTFNEFFHLPDGRSVRVIVIPYSLGNIIFSYEDMTDRLALESSYNSLLGVQRATLSNLHEALCVFGENGKLALYNPKFALLWNLSEEFLNSKPLLPSLFEEYKKLFISNTSYEEHKQKMISGYIRRKKFAEIIERKDEIFINRIMVPLPDGATLISDLDITASVIAERALLEKNKALQDADRIKTEFLTNISYELRSPLTSIMGYAEIINRRYAGELSLTQQDYIKYIISSSQNLASLVDDIMDLTLAEAGKIELEYVSFDVIQAIKVILEILNPKLHKIKFYFDDKKDHFIIGDQKRFKQIIFKLLCNAIEYSEIDQEIDINVESDDQFCYITVTDRGTGIPEKDQEFIFDKFYQANNTKSSGRSGTGLGLSIVKKFVQLQGGTIEFISKESEGSSFTCRFPVSIDK